MKPKNTASALFLSHGGGPLPLLGDPAHREMVSCLRGIADSLPRPDAILVISAHWEAPRPSITGGATPALIYDYYNFPGEAYQIQYPCPGDPTLAADIHRTLAEADIAADLDEARGFDHGLFVPLKIMYPAADIPCVQLSLIDNMDAAAHLQLGKALRPLLARNLLIVGSGFSFHNLKAFFARGSAGPDSANRAFERWLVDTCSDDELGEDQRQQRLLDWQQAPHARYCHPREEHLLPLHVCYGAAGGPADRTWQLDILNKRASMYLWSAEKQQ